jgi:hypothetical protein
MQQSSQGYAIDKDGTGREWLFRIWPGQDQPADYTTNMERLDTTLWADHAKAEEWRREAVKLEWVPAKSRVWEITMTIKAEPLEQARNLLSNPSSWDDGEYGSES